MLNIVIFGPPGAGKGTQSQKLIEKYKLVHISTGDLFRMHTKNQTELGKKVKSIMDSGILVPDSITIDMLEEEAQKNLDAAGFIFDGFPRTVPQAEALDEYLSKKNSVIHAVVQLDVTEEEVKKRIETRRASENRNDDEEANLLRRLNEYFTKTIHVLPYYEQQGKLSKVNGIGNIEEIFTQICQKVENHQKIALLDS
ncbi:MAG: adenylate kinase [Verrucomicrobia bacterium]|nr:adenylate kinase [Cytophagales bacterium]